MRRKLVSAIDGIRNFHIRLGDDGDHELEMEEKIASEHCGFAKVNNN